MFLKTQVFSLRKNYSSPLIQHVSSRNESGPVTIYMKESEFHLPSNPPITEDRLVIFSVHDNLRIKTCNFKHRQKPLGLHLTERRWWNRPEEFS